MVCLNKVNWVQPNVNIWIQKKLCKKIQHKSTIPSLTKKKVSSTMFETSVYIYIYMRIILKQILKEQDIREWTRFIWCRIGTSG
jgi:hypothetical protein